MGRMGIVSNNHASVSAGVSFPLASVLGVVFIVLKLTGVIAWSWVWVLAPFWIGAALFVALVLAFILFALIVVSRR